MSSTDHQREFLSGGRSPAAKFRTKGTTINGRIIAEPHFRQQTDYVSKRPLTWPDGTPREQMLVEVEDSNGNRVTLYVKGQMRQAIRDGLDNAHAEKLEVGGHLTVCYVGDGEPVGGLSNGPKLYQAEYKPPAPAHGSWGEQHTLDDEPLF